MGIQPPLFPHLEELCGVKMVFSSLYHMLHIKICTCCKWMCLQGWLQQSHFCFLLCTTYIPWWRKFKLLWFFLKGKHKVWRSGEDNRTLKNLNWAFSPSAVLAFWLEYSGVWGCPVYCRVMSSSSSFHQLMPLAPLLVTLWQQKLSPESAICPLGDKTAGKKH